MLEGFSRNVSHQEIERILSEVETWWETAYEQAGVAWLPLDGITNFLFNDLGYEDIDEFEDAIQGSFHEFLNAFPHIELKEETTDKWFIRVSKPTPGPPRRLKLTVLDSKQLLNTCFLKAIDAELELPDIELTIGADSKRRIDSLYQHLVVAYENLENHAQLLGEGSEEASKIMEAVRTLKTLLDVEKPFEIVVTDPYGLSEFKPSDGVSIEELARISEVPSAALPEANSTVEPAAAATEAAEAAKPASDS